MPAIDRVFLRKASILRWILIGGMITVGFLLAKEVSSLRPDKERLFGYLVLGGGGLYGLWRGLRSVEHTMPRRRRRAARRAARRDPAMRFSGSRRNTIPYLIGPDLWRIALFPWADRMEVLLDRLLVGMFRSAHPQLSCRRAMWRALRLLVIGRSYWRGTKPGGSIDVTPRTALRDEEVLQYLLAVVVLLSSLFRLHILRYGRPADPFKREVLSALRRKWISFCLLEPNPHLFPPALPEAFSKEPNLALDREADPCIHKAFVGWIFCDDQTALGKLSHLLLEVNAVDKMDRQTS